jgi:hypothetical protein
VDHHQFVVFELDRYYLQRHSLRVIAEVNESSNEPQRTAIGRSLLEAKAAVLNDVARAFTRYPMLGRGASPAEIKRRGLDYFVRQY